MATWFRPCATLRLFLPNLVPPEVDTLLFVDTDFIFLDNPVKLIESIEYDADVNFKSGKLAAMAPCLFHYGSKANLVSGDAFIFIRLTKMDAVDFYRRFRTLAKADLTQVY